MASADLDYIRALLIAQTADPEPAPRAGMFGRLTLGKRRAPPAPLDLGRPAPRPRFDPSLFADADQELLLEQICGPTDGGSLEVETASPLPPPPARGEFGRRLDLEAETELILDRPAAEARRLQVLDASGRPIGEMLLDPHRAVARVAALHADDAHAVPYFPEDLMEPASPWAPAPPSEPMRPWIKALRNSGRPAAPSIPVEEPPAPKRKTRARKPKAKVEKAPPPPPPAEPPSLGHDLLAALALTLAHEHDILSDRLAAVTLFRIESTAAR